VIADSEPFGHLALAMFIINGSRVSTMQETIARIAGASFEFFTGKPLPKPQKVKTPANKASTRHR
jgi:hypothetical protein